MAFCCNICRATTIGRRVTRDDGAGVVFCANCGMGAVEEVPEATEPFYADGYYGADTGEQAGYQDYAFTAAHTQLWVRLMVGALRPKGGRILDVGCATGALLASLPDGFERFGIEVNPGAATAAAASGVTVLGTDVADPRLADGQWGSFDIITSIATFEHVLDFRAAVTTCLEALSAGGILIFEVPVISEISHNRDWYGGSFEHIYYPTGTGITHLFDNLPGVHWEGFESSIRGFSASYVGFATRDAQAFERASRLFLAMRCETLQGLELAERRLNLAYNVVHSFRPSPERVLALPDLLDVAATPPLLRRMSQLWHADAVAASMAPPAGHSDSPEIAKLRADNAAYIEARDFWKAQADAWETATKDAVASLKALQAEKSKPSPTGDLLSRTG
jgi:SAM-dependent methyltransferase